MAVILKKGEKVSLTKEAPGLKKVLVGLGWNANVGSGDDFDLDASVFLLNENGRVRSDNDFIFYNNLSSQDGSVVHSGDDRTGGSGGDNDDEVIKIDLSKIPSNIKEIAIVVTIYEATQRRQNFGMVRNAYIHLVDEDNNKEIVKYDLEEDYSTETAVIFGRIYLKDNEWRFSAEGNGSANGLEGFCRQFGVNI